MKLLLRPVEAAHALGISRTRVYEMIREGTMPGVVEFDGRKRISLRLLTEWLAEREAQSLRPGTQNSDGETGTQK